MHFIAFFIVAFASQYLEQDEQIAFQYLQPFVALASLNKAFAPKIASNLERLDKLQNQNRNSIREKCIFAANICLHLLFKAFPAETLKMESRNLSIAKGALGKVA